MEVASTLEEDPRPSRASGKTKGKNGFKALNGLLPSYIAETCLRFSAVHVRQTRNSKRHLKLPRFKQSYGQWSFMFSAVRLWNRLPEEFNFLIDYCVFHFIIIIILLYIYIYIYIYIILYIYYIIILYIDIYIALRKKIYVFFLREMCRLSGDIKCYPQ